VCQDLKPSKDEVVQHQLKLNALFCRSIFLALLALIST